MLNNSTSPTFARNFSLALLALTLTICACVRVDLSSPPLSVAVIPPTPRSTLTPPPGPTPALAPVIRWTTPEPACLLPDLEPGQHLSVSHSYTETERTASTPMLCHLERDSCGYNQLVGILDPAIVFKQEESPPYDTEDFVLHPAMLVPLTRLSHLVQAEWDGAYQLRVTDAYDSLLEHDPPESNPVTRYSLHYEGRAIDLTTWPVEPKLYGRLCALAHCAGFDWVHHEGNHCHASIKADSLCLACNK